MKRYIKLFTALSLFAISSAPALSIFTEGGISVAAAEETDPNAAINAEAETQPADELDIAAVKRVMLEATPITESQFQQIPEEAWLEYTDRVNNGGGDPGTAFSWALRDYPEVFEPVVNEYRRALTENFYLDEASLETISDQELLWHEYSVWLTAGGQEDLETLAERLVEEHDVEVQEDEAETDPLPQIKTAMIEATPITSDQFDAIPREQWIEYTDVINEEGGDPSTAYNWALRDFPDVFAQTIQYIREKLVNEFNLDQASLTEKVSDEELLWEEYSAWLVNGQEDLQALSDTFVTEYGVAKLSETKPEENQEQEEEEAAPGQTLPNTGEKRTGYVTYAAVGLLGLAGTGLVLRKKKSRM